MKQSMMAFSLGFCTSLGCHCLCAMAESARRNQCGNVVILEGKLKVEDCEKDPINQIALRFETASCQLRQDPSILKKYFKEYSDCPEYVVQDNKVTQSKDMSRDSQECIEGFSRNWETRVFWFNGEFLRPGET